MLQDGPCTQSDPNPELLETLPTRSAAAVEIPSPQSRPARSSSVIPPTYACSCEGGGRCGEDKGQRDNYPPGWFAPCDDRHRMNDTSVVTSRPSAAIGTDITDSLGRRNAGVAQWQSLRLPI